MSGDRLKIIFKWAIFLVIVAFISQFASSFLVGIIGGFASSKPYDESSMLLISAIIGMVVVLPFAYIFSYKAVVEYLKGGMGRYQKNVGISLALGVIFLAAAIGGGIGYFMTGKFDITTGLLPLLLGLIAGRKAEAKFVRK